MAESEISLVETHVGSVKEVRPQPLSMRIPV